MWRIETPRWIIASATMICSLVSFTPLSPRRWSGPETAHYKRFVNPRCAKLGVPREARWRVLLQGGILEVPWREATAIRSARREELLRLLSKITVRPEVDLLSGSLLVEWRETDGKPSPQWTLGLDV